MIYDSISRMTLSMFKYKLESFVQAQRARSRVQFNLNTLCVKGVRIFWHFVAKNNHNFIKSNMVVLKKMSKLDRFSAL